MSSCRRHGARTTAGSTSRPRSPRRWSRDPERRGGGAGSGNVSAAVAAESPANRAIEIREGGLPLQRRQPGRAGGRGPAGASCQRRRRVRRPDRRRRAELPAGRRARGGRNRRPRHLGLAVPSQSTASGASIGGSNIPPQASERVEQTVAAGRPGAGRPGRHGWARPATRSAATARPADGAPARHPPRRPTSTPAPGPDRPGVRLVDDLEPGAAARSRRASARAAGATTTAWTSPPRPARRPRGGVRHGEPRRPAERLREHRLHHAHQPVLDLLRAPVALRCVERARRCSRAR